jgi:hypothetical protein
MKQLIYKLTGLTYELSSTNRATLSAQGDAATPGWTDLELGNERVGDGILHFDFVGKPPDGIVTQVVTPVSTKHGVVLGSQPQDVTVHSATNELSVRLPAAGDPK